MKLLNCFIFTLLFFSNIYSAYYASRDPYTYNPDLSEDSNSFQSANHYRSFLEEYREKCQKNTEEAKRILTEEAKRILENTEILINPRAILFQDIYNQFSQQNSPKRDLSYYRKSYKLALDELVEANDALNRWTNVLNEKEDEDKEWNKFNTEYISASLHSIFESLAHIDRSYILPFVGYAQIESEYGINPQESLRNFYLLEDIQYSTICHKIKEQFYLLSLITPEIYSWYLEDSRNSYPLTPLAEKFFSFMKIYKECISRGLKGEEVIHRLTNPSWIFDTNIDLDGLVLDLDTSINTFRLSAGLFEKKINDFEEKHAKLKLVKSGKQKTGERKKKLEELNEDIKSHKRMKLDALNNALFLLEIQRNIGNLNVDKSKGKLEDSVYSQLNRLLIIEKENSTLPTQEGSEHTFAKAASLLVEPNATPIEPSPVEKEVLEILNSTKNNFKKAQLILDALKRNAINHTYSELELVSAMRKSKEDGKDNSDFLYSFVLPSFKSTPKETRSHSDYLDKPTVSVAEDKSSKEAEKAVITQEIFQILLKFFHGPIQEAPSIIDQPKEGVTTIDAEERASRDSVSGKDLSRPEEDFNKSSSEMAPQEMALLPIETASSHTDKLLEENAFRSTDRLFSPINLFLNRRPDVPYEEQEDATGASIQQDDFSPSVPSSASITPPPSDRLFSASITPPPSDKRDRSRQESLTPPKIKVKTRGKPLINFQAAESETFLAAQTETCVKVTLDSTNYTYAKSLWGKNGIPLEWIDFTKLMHTLGCSQRTKSNGHIEFSHRLAKRPLMIHYIHRADQTFGGRDLKIVRHWFEKHLSSHVFDNLGEE